MRDIDVTAVTGSSQVEIDRMDDGYGTAIKVYPYRGPSHGGSFES